MNIAVSQPTVALQNAFLQMLDDYDTHDPENGVQYAAARADFGIYVQGKQDDEQGLIGIVPCSHRWLVSGQGAIVGIVRVRHHINTDFLANEVGHIGYDVPPSHRGNGFGVAALQSGLEHARELGFTQVMLYADTDNSASWRTIERCGGVLEAECYSSFHSCLVRRYWIKVSPALYSV